jgi:sugar phosphate isomerase/epimerase
MLKRRDFLKSTGTVALGSLVFSGKLHAALLSNPVTQPVGVQLYTFFNVIDNDVPGTLKKIADIGYKEIESAFSKKGGYYGMQPKEFAFMLKDMGLSWKSHHVIGAPFKLPPGAKPPLGADGKPITLPPMKNLRDNFQEVIDDVAEGGVPYLVCASTPIHTLDEVKSSIEVLNKASEAAKKAGIQMAYHNHYQEFAPVEGQLPYDLILSQTDPDLLKMELDVAWAIKGGADVPALFKKHTGRFPLWHVKNLDKDMKTVVPVGDGFIDYKTIFAQAETAGMKHFFVEHDMPSDPVASITSSFRSVQKILG